MSIVTCCSDQLFMHILYMYLLYSIACPLILYMYMCMDPTHYTQSALLIALIVSLQTCPYFHQTISASSETSDDPVQHLVTRSRDRWCSVESFDSRPSATLNFTHPVALVNMTARGGVAGFSYVTNFSVEVFNETTGQFMTYSFSGDQIVCTSPNISYVIDVT